MAYPDKRTTGTTRLAIGIANTSPTGRDVWRLTYNGQVRGDAQGYSRVEAIRHAQSMVLHKIEDGYDAYLDIEK